MTFKTIPVADTETKIADGVSTDAFSRLRVSNPQGVFDCQFTYDLQPLLFEQITLNTGAAVAHDATNRNALMTFASTPTGGKAFMQSYQYHRYQPGKSHRAIIAFNFLSSVANVVKFAGYSDGVNGIEFQNNGITNRFVLYSGSTNGNQTVNQADWNLDKFDGTGISGITLDITKAQILLVDLQALYTGRVRVGFDIGGKLYYVHEFNHANVIVHPYIANASLPIRCGMTCTGTVSTTMKFHCSAVQSEGGHDINAGYEYAQSATVTAGSGTKTHLLSIRPKTTFNGIVTRTEVGVIEIDILVTGNSPIQWELVIGQAISGTTTFNDVNSTYADMEYNSAGTISGSPSVVIDMGYLAASNQTKSTVSMKLTSRYPITLDAAGLNRLNGTLTLVVTGLGGASACYGAIKWVSIR